jgi:hypothetical protein
MPKILFASNNIAHWPTAVAGSVPGTFDSDRVPYSIAMSNYETLNSPKFAPSTGESTWFHFRIFANSLNYNNTDPLLNAYAEDGTLLFRLRKKDNSYTYGITADLYDGGASITGTSTISLTEAKIGFIDAEYIVTPLKIELKLYVNGTRGLTLLLNSNPNSFTAPVAFSLGCAFTNNLTNIQHVSEIIVADGDTRNARLDLLRPLAAGAYEDWQGNLAALADDDPTTGMTTIAPAERQTVTLSAYTGASNISNFVIVSQTTRGQNSPTGLKHTIRLSTVDYDSDLIPVDFPLQYNITDFEVNPATSLPWQGSDLSLIETGFVSVA